MHASVVAYLHVSHFSRAVIVFYGAVNWYEHYNCVNVFNGILRIFYWSGPDYK